METLQLMYSKTYNFVYLRAKSILEKEEDVCQLMKEVYQKAVAEKVAQPDWYRWLGMQVYLSGSAKFRKKKVREADLIELDSKDYSVQESVDKEKTKEVICEALDGLPDLYLATLYACHCDHLTLREISTVMGYSVGAIINRLNYTHKYLKRTLENYREEHNYSVRFSIEILCEALYDWSEMHQLSEQSAQNIFAVICRAMGMQSQPVSADELAGLHTRIVEIEEREETVVCNELESYRIKKSIDKKKLFAFIGIILLSVITFAGVFLAGANKESNKEKDRQEQEEIIIEEQEDTGEDEGISSPDTEEEEQPVESEYVLPQSDKEKLTRADLEGLTKEELRLARNEIYARHGMIFGVADLDQYFSTKSWYRPTISFSEFYDTVEMSLIEENNVSLIQQVEKEKN